MVAEVPGCPVAAMKKSLTSSTATKKAARTKSTAKKATTALKQQVEEMATQLESVQTYRQVERKEEKMTYYQVEEMARQLSSVQKQVEELVTVTSALQKKLEGNMKPRHPTAAPPPKRPSNALPFPWEQHYSEMYKVPYFWNSLTGESVWERTL